MTNPPDFDDMMGLADRIGELTREKIKLDARIKLTQAEVTKEALINPKYYQNGKPLSVSYVKETYQVTGFENEVIELQRNLAEIIGELETTKLKFDVMRMMFEQWKTEYYNTVKTSTI
jgi:predicted translin family RNA/ssDNA-binding protein